MAGLKRRLMMQQQVGLFALLALCLGIVLVACAFPGSTKPVLKIGLIAPFEGVERPHGYQRLYGVKLALQEINLTGGMAGYKVALVALNDYAEATETTLQAQELVIDSDIIGVIGQWDTKLFAVSKPIYTEAQLAVVSPNRFADFEALPTTFQADFVALGGSAPDRQAQQAYLATYHLLEAIDQAGQTYGSPTRPTVWRVLSGLD